MTSSGVTKALPRRNACARDACANAISILLEEGTPEALTRIKQLLSRVPPEARVAAPQLIYNEAVYLLRTGQTNEGERALERLLRATQGQPPWPALVESARQYHQKRIS